MQIAYEVRIGNVKEPRKVKFDDFILKFKTKREAKEMHSKNPNSKALWMQILGATKKIADDA